MVCLSQIQEDRARSKAGMNRKNVIVNPEVLRKELLKVFYAKEVDEMMEIICFCDMKEPEPKNLKKVKTMKDFDGAVITAECDFEEFIRDKKSIY